MFELPLRYRAPSASAIEIPGGPSASVGELLENARDVAVRLRQRGAGDYQSCLLVSSRDPSAFIAGIFGCWMAGATAACWSEDVYPAEVLAELVSANGLIRANKSGLGIEIEDIDGHQWMERHPGNLVVTTSGSTGKPKGVSLDAATVSLNAYLAGCAIGLERMNGWSFEIDFALMSALSHFLMAWQFDMPLVFLGNATPADKNFFFSKAGAGYGGPPLLLKRLEETLAPEAVPEMLVSSGDFLLPVVIDKLRKRFPDCSVNSFYGLTEVSGRFCCLTYDELDRHKGHAGRPLPGFCFSLVDDDGVVCGDGEEGEVLISGPMLFNGYYRGGRTFDPMERGGWFRTNDLGILQPDGIVALAGRKNDVFKVSGEKVDRMTIEQHIAEIAGDADFCVLPVDHPLVGQCPALFLAESSHEKPLRRTDIILHLKGRLPSQFIPVYYYLVGSFPRLANGKLDKQTLTRDRTKYDRLA